MDGRGGDLNLYGGAVGRTIERSREFQATFTGIARASGELTNARELTESLMGDIVDRLVWYCQVANRVAWAVQYRKEPDLFGDEAEPAATTERLAETQRLRQYIGRIRYNLATNDGNVFLKERWRELLDNLADALAVEQLERMGMR